MLNILNLAIISLKTTLITDIILNSSDDCDTATFF